MYFYSYTWDKQHCISICRNDIKSPLKIILCQQEWSQLKNMKQILVQVICWHGKNCGCGTHAKTVGSSDLFQVLHLPVWLCVLFLNSGCSVSSSVTMELHCPLLLEVFPDFSTQNQLCMPTAHYFTLDLALLWILILVRSSHAHICCDWKPFTGRDHVSIHLHDFFHASCVVIGKNEWMH